MLAWLPVGIWFIVAVWVGKLVAAERPPAAPSERRRTVGWILAEAGVVTLFASLWFDSLGSGGWWLLFLLVGLLAAFPVRLHALPPPGALRRAELVKALVDTLRYVGAGAILAWRLR